MKFAEKYIHNLVLQQKERLEAGQLEVDRRLHAVSGVTPDKKGLFVLVSECKAGVESAAVFFSDGPGHVVYMPGEVEPQCAGSLEFLGRAHQLAETHTHIPAVKRRYPPKETPK